MSNKSFREGVVAGSKPFEEKFKLQSETIEKIGKRLDTRMNEFSEINDAIINDLTSIEKKRLYDLNTVIDIAELDSTEKEFLLALIYTVSNMSENTTEFQKRFVRSVKNYLGVASPQTEVNISLIENIENINAQKAILQTIMEFLFLENGNHSYFESYEEATSHFSVNKRGIEEIQRSIDNIHSATGLEGITEKYGYVPEEPKKEFVEEESFVEEFCWDDFGEGFPEVILSEGIEIGAGDTKTFENCIVHVRSDINCKGYLVFRNCIVHYNELDSRGEISLAKKASLEIINSKVVCEGYTDKYFIKGSYDDDYIAIKNCFLEDCGFFIDLVSKVLIYKSKIQNPLCFLRNPISNGVIKSCSIDFKDFSEKVENCINSIEYKFGTFSVFDCDVCDPFNENKSFIVKDCIIKSQDPVFKNINAIFSVKGAIYENCNFKNCNFEAENEFSSYTGSCILGAKKIVLSKFQNCSHVISEPGLSRTFKVIDNCIFESCKNIISGSNINVFSCQFIDCMDNIIHTGYDGNAKVKYCEFYNIELGNATGLLFLKSNDKKHSETSRIESCVFSGVNARNEFLIRGQILERISGMAVDIWNCSFENCITENKENILIDEYDGYYGLFSRYKKRKVVSVNKCEGLNQVNKQNKEPQDMSVRTETALGEKIGASISK